MNLSPTASFLDHYLHLCGDTQVPIQFQIWCGLALVAASVADRVWYEKFKGKKLAPNLYIALIGPGACGKGEAIENAINLAVEHPQINVYNGRGTPQFLTDYMSKSRTLDGKIVAPDSGGAFYKNSKIWVVQEELGAAIDRGDSADGLVKFFTQNYTTRRYLTQDGTVTRGLKSVVDPVFNWLFGSNLRWMMDVFPESSISGGTWGRIVGVQGGYNFDKRIEIPVYPPDWEEVRARVHRKLDDLCEVEGAFSITDKARNIMSAWFHQRPAPSDEAIAPAWIRQHDLVFKLAMILSLSDGCDLRIRSRHVIAAQKMSDDALGKLSEIQTAAQATPETRGIAFLRGRLKKSRGRPVLHYELMRQYSKIVGDRDSFERDMKTLLEGREASQVGNGMRMVYTWQARRKMPKELENGQPE